MSFHKWNISEEGLLYALYGAALLLLKWVSKRVLVGIKFAYKFYQERKEIKVTVIMSWRLWFWILASLTISYLIGLTVWIFVMRAESAVIAGQSINKSEYIIDQQKFKSEFSSQIDSEKDFIILHIDSIKKHK